MMTRWLRTGGRKVAEGLFEVRPLEGVDDGRSWPLRPLYFCAVLSAAIEPLRSQRLLIVKDASENRAGSNPSGAMHRTSSSVDRDNSKIAVWAWDDRHCDGAPWSFQPTANLGSRVAPRAPARSPRSDATSGTDGLNSRYRDKD